MKRITITLTEQQLWEVKSQVAEEIQRLEKLVLEKEHKTFRDELAFLKRLRTTLATQAKS